MIEGGPQHCRSRSAVFDLCREAICMKSQEEVSNVSCGQKPCLSVPSVQCAGTDTFLGPTLLELTK